MASRGDSNDGSGFHDPTDAEMDAYVQASGFYDLDNAIAFQPPSLPQGFVDSVAGFGNGIFNAVTFGFGDLDSVRGSLGIDGGVNQGSHTVYSFGLGGVGVARAAGWTVRFSRYPNAGGAGMTVLRNGTRRFGADWHRFKLNGEMVNRPHYHRGATGNQMRKHRPWQGGW